MAAILKFKMAAIHRFQRISNIFPQRLSIACAGITTKWTFSIIHNLCYQEYYVLYSGYLNSGGHLGFFHHFEFDCHIEINWFWTPWYWKYGYYHQIGPYTVFRIPVIMDFLYFGGHLGFDTLNPFWKIDNLFFLVCYTPKTRNQVEFCF